MRGLAVLAIIGGVLCSSRQIAGGDTAPADTEGIEKVGVLKDNTRQRVDSGPEDVRAIGGVLKKWFEAYLADEPGLAKQTYLPRKHNRVERDLQQLKRLLEAAPKWRFRPMVIMAGGVEGKAISSGIEVPGPAGSDAAVLIVHLQKVAGQWYILYWSADVLRAVPDFYPHFRRKYPGALIWFDETVDQWLRPDQETEIDVNIEELLSTASVPKTEKTLAQNLREARGEQSIFESYFPDSAAGGRILDSWWEVKAKQTYPDEDIFTMIRNGLRRAKDGKPRSSKEQFIRWVGQRYIRPKEPKNKKAVELMYYASFDPDLTKSAVYYGLSVAGAEQDSKVLKRLVDICMSDIYVGRILWGTKGKHDKMVQYLEPYLNDPDDRVCERASILEKAFSGELDYEKWQQARFKKQRQSEFGDKLATIREVLLKGNSRQRRDVFSLIKRNGLTVLFDESFIEPLKVCLKDADPVVKEMAVGFGGDFFCKAGEENREVMQLMSELCKDSDSKVRKTAAVFAGNCWICGAKPQKPGAIKMMIQLSRDEDAEVRNAAVYYGLSVVENKSDEVVKRLIEMAVDTSGLNDVGRIMWGLGRGADKEKMKLYLKPYIFLKNKKGELARKVYFEIFGGELESGALIL